tara:strand:+ start:156 stop:362 length:207 start_codon:yes stop_codon:yes gene_type:complete
MVKNHQKKKNKEKIMSREFVDAVSTGDNLEAENAFKVAITTKVGASLEDKRKEVSKTFVGKYEDQNNE